jgi:hypothetical protein
VRETWQGLTFGDFRPTKHKPCEVRYFATDPCADLDAEARGYGWRPSIFMPRFASRLTLTVAAVRVQRLQDISEADAIAEGVTPGLGGGPITEDFLCLWNNINGPFAASENPWVAAYTFTVERKNIDEAKRP